MTTKQKPREKTDAQRAVVLRQTMRGNPRKRTGHMEPGDRLKIAVAREAERARADYERKVLETAELERIS